MRMRVMTTYVSVVVGCLVLASFQVFAQGKTITWLQFDLQPAYIFEGTYSGKGMQQMIDQFLMGHLPEYHHKVSKSNLKRIALTLEQDKQVVSGGLLLTPQRQHAFEVSVPHGIALSAGLVMLKERREAFQPFLDHEGKIDLGRLITQSDLTGGIAFGRHYSGSVDHILTNHQGHPDIYVRKGQNISEGLVKMLFVSRIDYTILFPNEAQYVTRLMGKQDELSSVPIKGMPDYALVVAVAPKTAWGKAIIKKINAILRPARQTQGFYEWRAFWYDDAAKKRLRTYMEEFMTRQPGENE